MEGAKTDLHGAFKSFAMGKEEMQTAQFKKLCKDCGITAKQSEQNLIDNTLMGVIGNRSKVITFPQFKEILQKVAVGKKTTFEALEQKICSKGGPKFQGTKADYVKFHDDKSTYTGVYAKGGPTTVDAGRGGQVSDISQICDRSGADVRGVKK